MLALQDLWGTYLLPRFRTQLSTANASSLTRSEADIAKCLDAERDSYLLARASGAKVALVQHLTLPEVTGKYDRGYYANQAVAKEQQVPFVDDGDEIRADLKSGRSPYYEGDVLHPNDLGQQALAQALLRAVNLGLSKPAN
jgi:lysophospholipase L1-like esterase